ncbi:MAG TPA: hypothetical protein VGL56_05285 [Fimbriimonadaceae bacterium]|jgi:hypothetical protein
MTILLILDIEVHDPQRAEPFGEADVASVEKRFELPSLPFPGLKILFNEKADSFDEQLYKDFLEANEELSAGIFVVDSVMVCPDTALVHVQASHAVSSRKSLSAYLSWLKNVYGFSDNMLEFD